MITLKISGSDEDQIIDVIMKRVSDIAQDAVADLLVELQKNRFDNQGQFNDNKRWADNDREVEEDKGRNEPLVDSGRLKKSLQSKQNWLRELSKTSNSLQKSGDDLFKMQLPQKENFTDPLYNKLETGFRASSYISSRGNRVFAGRHPKVPPRPFREISQDDTDWIAGQLVDKIIGNLR